MLRRDFLMSVPLAVLMAQLRSVARLKITGIRIVNLKVIRETGKMEGAWDPGTLNTWRVGGGSVIEIQTDQGISGIGPGIDPAWLEASEAQLVGRDPFSIEQLAGPLRYYVGGSARVGEARASFRAWKLRCGTLSARPPASPSTKSGARPRTAFRPTPA